MSDETYDFNRGVLFVTLIIVIVTILSGADLNETNTGQGPGIVAPL